MNKICMGERILFLRKKSGITQEQLAKKLGVSNQAVSKWESGQCLPDIQLIPQIALFFRVSIDELFGLNKDIEQNGYRFCTQIENVNSVTNKEYEDIMKGVKAAHAIAWVAETKKEESALLGLDLTDTIECMIRGEWGTSHVVIPQITTIMRSNCVFFSHSKKLNLQESDIKKLCEILVSFSSRLKLGVFLCIYDMTCQDEEVFVRYEQISSVTMLSIETIKNIIDNELNNYLFYQYENGGIRIKSEYMYIAPILSVLLPII